MTLPSPQSCSNCPGHCASITVFPDFLCVTSGQALPSHTHRIARHTVVASCLDFIYWLI